MEPAFGVIIPRPNDAPSSEPDAHGVIHQITVADFLQIVATEGGGGHPELGYSLVELTVVATDGTNRTFDKVLSLGAGTRCRFDLLCSQRYKDIVIDGARRGNVKQSYIDYLETIPHYDTLSTRGRRIGRFIFQTIFGLFVWPAYSLVLGLKLEAGGTATYVFR